MLSFDGRRLDSDSLSDARTWPARNRRRLIPHVLSSSERRNQRPEPETAGHKRANEGSLPGCGRGCIRTLMPDVEVFKLIGGSVVAETRRPALIDGLTGPQRSTQSERIYE